MVPVVRGVGSACLLVAVLCVAAANGRCEDWPTYAHDHRRSDVTAERLAPPLSLRWIFRSPLPPAKGWAPPVNGYGATKNKSNVSYDDAPRTVCVGDTVLFCSSAENKVYAVDATRGRVKWTFIAGAPPRLTPAVYAGRVYFGADDGTAYCLNADDGSVVWRFNAAPTPEKILGTGRFMSLWPLRTGVLVEQGVAYFAAGLFPSEGVYLFAVDAGTGRLLWRRNLHLGSGDCPSPQGYLLASGDSLYMTSRVAPTRWALKDGKRISFSTPISNHEHRFHNGGSYAQLWGDTLVYGQAAILGYDVDRTWKDKYGRTQRGSQAFLWFNARRALLNDGIAYFATDEHLLAVRHELLPELSARVCHDLEMAYKKCRVASYLTTQEALLEHGEDSPVGRHLKETSLKWGRASYERWPAVAEALYAKFAEKCAWMLPIHATEALVLAGDVLYAGGEEMVVAVDARSGRVLWRDTTNSRVRGLTVANGRLLVSTVDGNVRCYTPDDRKTVQEDPIEVLPPPNQSPYPPGRHGAFYAATAEAIVAAAGTKRGYCLILGGGSGRLAHEIVQRTQLSISVIESDPDELRQARAALSAAGLYGGRVTVEQGTLESLPFPPYVFNLVVDQQSIFGHASSTPPEELFRVTKPCGGVICAGQPAGGEQLGTRLDADTWLSKLRALGARNADVSVTGAWATVVRGRVKDAADWTHNYATAANTYCSEDPLVKGPFGVLWYGDPGPRQRIDRHSTPPVPLVVGSRAFLLGYDTVMAYDIYNGLCYWQRTILGATRTGLPLGTSNLAADAHSLFIVVGDRQCLRLDAATGETIQTYPVPAPPDGRDGYWGWIATVDGVLFGSSAQVDAPRRKPDARLSNSVFALDAATGKSLWTYAASGIDHDGIAVAGGRVFLLDRTLSEAERRQALQATVVDKSFEDRPAIDRRGKPVQPDLRKLVVLDAGTGRVIWQKPLNCSDITLDDTVVSEGRVGIACMVHDGVVVVHGTGSLGHPYQEFLRGEFARRAIYAFDVNAGRLLWGGRKNYRKRPIIVGDYVYAEPRAWNLRTGEPKTYVHPVSEKPEPLDFFRGYIGCSHLLGSAVALFGNQQGIGYLNLDSRCGYASFGSVALACGLGAVPAGGVFVAPEGRAGCTCDTPIFTSIALYPRTRDRGYSRGVPGGVSAPTVTPVRHMAINLGAPGFREDGQKTLWIPYPARDCQGLLGDWLPSYGHATAMFYRYSDDWLSIEGTTIPWVFTSGYTNPKPLRFRLLAAGQPAAQYTIRLYFAEPDAIEAGQRVFDVLLQTEQVLTDLDVVRQAGGPRKTLVKEFRDVSIDGELVVELRPTAASRLKTPILCGIEAIRQLSSPKTSSNGNETGQ